MAEPAPEPGSTVECVGCRGRVPDVDGPIHRYMTASPGCWRAYTELMAGGLPAIPEATLAVDAYAVTHPGVPGPQSTPSVWIHLITLYCTLERGWPVDRAVFLRRMAADAFRSWPWLDRPERMGSTTAIDIADAVRSGDGGAVAARTTSWVNDAWAAWSAHHLSVRAQASLLIRRLG